MDKLKQWLVRRPQLRSIFPNLFVLVSLMVLLAHIGQSFAHMHVAKAQVLTNSGTTSALIRNLSVPELFLWVGLVGPILEEIQFRLAPFSVIFLISSLTGFSKTAFYLPALCLCVIATSIMFGSIHGVGGVFMQGPLGFVLCVVFLKWSGLGESAIATLKGCVAAIVLHSSYNICVIATGLILAA